MKYEGIQIGYFKFIELAGSKFPLDYDNICLNAMTNVSIPTRWSCLWASQRSAGGWSSCPTLSQVFHLPVVFSTSVIGLGGNETTSLDGKAVLDG